MFDSPCFIIIFKIFCLFFIYGCVGSSFLCEGFLQLWRAGATLHRGARASHYRGLSCCGAQAPDAQAQQLWLMGPAAPRHVGSSQTRAWTRVPCIGRQIPNHCTTREAPITCFNLNVCTPLEVGIINAHQHFFFFNWSLVDLQHCVSFSYTAKWFSDFQILFPYRLLQNIE